MCNEITLQEVLEIWRVVLMCRLFGSHFFFWVFSPNFSKKDSNDVWYSISHQIKTLFYQYLFLFQVYSKKCNTWQLENNYSYLKNCLGLGKNLLKLYCYPWLTLIISFDTCTRAGYCNRHMSPPGRVTAIGKTLAFVLNQDLSSL